MYVSPDTDYPMSMVSYSDAVGNYCRIWVILTNDAIISRVNIHYWMPTKISLMGSQNMF